MIIFSKDEPEEEPQKSRHPVLNMFQDCFRVS